MPCKPRAAILLTAHTKSCCLPQIELVVPKRMSGFTGSSDFRGAEPQAWNGSIQLAATVKPEKARAEDKNSRLLSLRSERFTDIDTPFCGAGFCLVDRSHPV